MIEDAEAAGAIGPGSVIIEPRAATRASASRWWNAVKGYRLSS